MALPQPVPEPLMLDDGSESVIPLPANVRIVRGSEVVEATRDPDRKGTLVNVWASWCGSCKVEMPMLLEVQKRYEPRGIKLVLVSVDNAAQAGDAESFLKERGVEGTVLLAHPKLGYFKQALSPIWRGALPASFLYDNTGRLRYYWGAQVFESELVPILDGLLRGEDINGMANFKVRG